MALYIQFSDDGRDIHKWSRRPFEGGLRFERDRRLTEFDAEVEAKMQFFATVRQDQSRMKFKFTADSLERAQQMVVDRINREWGADFINWSDLQHYTFAKIAVAEG